MNPVMEQSLFDQIGGMAAVDAAVDIFYTRVLADESISHFFRWTHMKSQHAKQRAFLAYAFGAPLNYSGKSMRDAHAHLVERGLNEGHFNAVMGHLVATLQELGIPEELMAEAGKIAESTRHDVLGQ
ncbi:MAG: group 1 truncated hemoglobin [Cyclobacteriaceae bacterium]